MTASAIYNEIDPFAASWMRNLIAAGHVAPGVVDERSIEDLKPADVAGPGQRHFFAGIAGWSYALRLAGISDDADIWTGSCPCQPFSSAGKRGGTSDARHLWPAWFELIRECRPPAIFGEQVASRDGLAWLDIVRADLERCGYAFGASDLCAAGIGAPHIRQRLYFVAYAGRERREGKRLRVQPGQSRARRLETGGAAKLVGNSSGSRSGRHTGAVSDAQATREGTGLVDRRERDESVDAGADDIYQRLGVDRPSYWLDGRVYYAESLADSSGDECASRRGRATIQGRAEPRRPTEQLAGRSVVGVGNASGRSGDIGVRGGQDAQDLGRSSSRTSGQRDAASGSFDHWRVVEWLDCTDGKRRPTKPGLQPLAHGVPNRVGTLSGSGNAIVPQCAAIFIIAAEEAREERGV